MKRTYQPSILSKKRTHGFLTRSSSASGKKVLLRRHQKGRKHIC